MEGRMMAEDEAGLHAMADPEVQHAGDLPDTEEQAVVGPSYLPCCCTWPQVQPALQRSKRHVVFSTLAAAACISFQCTCWQWFHAQPNFGLRKAFSLFCIHKPAKLQA